VRLVKTQKQRNLSWEILQFILRFYKLNITPICSRIIIIKVEVPPLQIHVPNRRIKIIQVENCTIGINLGSKKYKSKEYKVPVSTYINAKNIKFL